MLRVAVIAILGCLLSGCWGSETRLFGPKDWVQPPGIAGKYISKDADGEKEGTVVLVVRADGMIVGTVTQKGEKKPRTSAAGFVAIPGGAGQHFLLVQRASETEGGEIYMIARLRGDGVEAFWPQCSGTPDMPGMRRDTAELINEEMCSFTSRQAVLNAALLAERELSRRTIFGPQSAGRLERIEEPGS